MPQPYQQSGVVEQWSPGMVSEGNSLPYSLISAGTGDDANVIKDAPGRVTSIMATNVNAAVRYVKLYDKATAPTTSDVPVFRGAIPGATTGGGFVFPLPPTGLIFRNGIGIRLVTGVADNDGTDVAATEIVVNIGYS